MNNENNLAVIQPQVSVTAVNFHGIHYGSLQRECQNYSRWPTTNGVIKLAKKVTAFVFLLTQYESLINTILTSAIFCEKRLWRVDCTE